MKLDLAVAFLLISQNPKYEPTGLQTPIPKAFPLTPFPIEFACRKDQHQHMGSTPLCLVLLQLPSWKCCTGTPVAKNLQTGLSQIGTLGLVVKTELQMAYVPINPRSFNFISLCGGLTSMAQRESMRAALEQRRSLGFHGAEHPSRVLSEKKNILNIWFPDQLLPTNLSAEQSQFLNQQGRPTQAYLAFQRHHVKHMTDVTPAGHFRPVTKAPKKIYFNK